MKFKITMKHADGVYDSVTDAVTESLAAIEGISDDERETLEETRREEVNEVIGKWFECGEYLTIKIDTDAMTATVCEND